MKRRNWTLKRLYEQEETASMEMEFDVPIIFFLPKQ